MTPGKFRELCRRSTTVCALAAIVIVLSERAHAQAADHRHRATAERPAAPAGDTAHMADMADHAMSGAMDENMMKHMELTPLRRATHDDSTRARRVAAELKLAIARYQDTAVAIADGYRMFLPGVKTQKVYHFTNNARAAWSALHFDPAKPTSVLYTRAADGRLHLVGAMYTLGVHAGLNRLDSRVPLGIARWHKHVNWCMPASTQPARWAETRNGKPLFGPESAIATKAECNAVNGQFHDHVFGWMLHANVFAGATLGEIFADDHGGQAEHSASRK